MMSNIVNNAVEALDGKENGIINLKLNMADNHLKVIIQDNGKGMSQEVINKIMNNVAITAGKKYGHGIGFVQIREALQSSNGKFEIDSKVGKGAKITLSFPIIESPAWLAREIKLNKGDTVVILDDDKSIHHAWASNFEEYKKDICLKYFTLGTEVIDFIDKFSAKEKLFLLTDFELLKQELNGMHIIERTKVKRSLLVTSHYNNLVVRDLAIKNKTKILPKVLASEIPIKIVKHSRDTVKIGRNSNKNQCALKDKFNRQKVDLIIIDDSVMLVDALVELLTKKGKIVDKYYKPKEFLKSLEKYPKDTKILLDNDLQAAINDICLAKQLYAKGYTQLYLFSDKDFVKGEVPDYLTVILKLDTDRVCEIVGC